MTDDTKRKSKDFTEDDLMEVACLVRDAYAPHVAVVTQDTNPKIGSRPWIAAVVAKHISALKGVAHLVLFSSQPYVKFACEPELRYVWSGDPEDPEPGVHRSGDSRYTFDLDKATCKECLRIFAQGGS